MTTAPVLHAITDLTAYKISPDDTVVLVVLSGPKTSGSSTTVCFEIWEPGGSQPDNSHADSTETFVVLRGGGTAHSDEHAVELTAGSVIVLPTGSVHRIVNTSATDKMYALTVMENDGGFEDLILRGTPTPLAADDVAVLAAAGPLGAPRE
ncbi:cupin domain-containing protein [Gordonia sp. zg691]|uniref:Cupin domain-containing protein n=1 Tax=Gordonia jinghuaiqii TaxID=2758710 RepID=A0A7D7QGI7_9ACTN|nr:cupin domain-containing protein [Gordonia jinghuaiqii]MBD0860680.1 cupin domain-containing protein [Gordonia jinghuaiqii]MCR5978054.1 cupin domain-containing protein [Gordonia jinghuaiqii]QMT01482.1 cupin domain-containing protein [Gordonia jinghuaiqii]